MDIGAESPSRICNQPPASSEVSSSKHFPLLQGNGVDAHELMILTIRAATEKVGLGKNLWGERDVSKRAHNLPYPFLQVSTTCSQPLASLNSPVLRNEHEQQFLGPALIISAGPAKILVGWHTRDLPLAHTTTLNSITSCHPEIIQYRLLPKTQVC